MMDESRRRAYLRAMGIDLWVPRWEAAAGDHGRVTAAPAPAEPPRPPHPAAPTVEPPVVLPPAPTGMDWDTLAATVAGCRACALCETRTQTVFGIGDRQAHLLVIGEAPGADEDRAGEPFVGRAGQLLNRMLAAIGLGRDQVYIANILKCRPPGNRGPHPDEVEHCRGYLARQIALVRPRAMLSVGRISAQTLLGTDTPIGRLRGRWFDYGPDAVPLRVTYHPAYLLRSPEYKSKAWEDLIALAQRLGDRAH
jgi:uracil-DNA glycosylase